MELYLKNIGKIKESTIKLRGITVIAGENNTGKSTVGKALFSVFNSFYGIDNKIWDEKIEFIRRRVSALVRQEVNSNHFKLNKVTDLLEGAIEFIDQVVVNDILEQLKKEKNNPWFNSEKYGGQFQREIITRCVEKYFLDLEFANMLIKKIYDEFKAINSISRERFLNLILEKKLSDEFSGQICNIYEQKEGEICIKVKSDQIKIILSESKVDKIMDEILLNTEVIYIDNPFVIDEWSDFHNFGNNLINTIISRHKDHLIRKLGFKENNIVDELMAKEKLENVFLKLNQVCSGSTVSSDRILGYQNVNSDKVLDIRNISTGMKTFMILKTLLLNGAIRENGTIVLDEPEIHLHPEWQLLFAELIVLLQKEFGLHILLTTHSPYFLNAIEVYSEKYKIVERCEYYLAENKNDFAQINEVTANLEAIYSKLARPLQVLENERYRDEED